MKKLQTHNRAIETWLYACCGMIFVMAILGAVTRLTGSGLSITEWAPVKGFLPPLSNAEWQRLFGRYQDIPQYKIFNQGMTLSEFKDIFFWEWLHRFWGRLIGFVFAVPFVYFVIRRQINLRLGIKLALIFGLGGLQGFIGWFMVQSGLEVGTSVNPLRLALHLFFALLCYSLLLWVGLSLTCARLFGTLNIQSKKIIFQLGVGALGCLVLTIIWGAFVAGLRAGLVYNTWPMMEGYWLPPEAWNMQPYWQNFFENTAMVQFIHRWGALFTGVCIFVFAWLCLKQAQTALANNKNFLTMAEESACDCNNKLEKARFRAASCLGGMVLVQVGLGLATLLTQLAVPLAVLHQAGAILLLTFIILNVRLLRV